MATVREHRGRARDPEIDARILAVANRHLAGVGYEAMSLTAVAREAGTTRQALYRRWPTKAALADAALEVAADAQPATAPGVAAGAHPASASASADPLADLVAELSDFRRGVLSPGRLSLVGTMLQDSTAPGLRTRYQARVIAPRRARLLAILRHAQQLELIDAEADLEVAITMCTGSWYANALAGLDPPENWPQRAATLVWRAVGGAVG